MKKTLYYILIAVAAAWLASCNEDDGISFDEEEYDATAHDAWNIDYDTTGSFGGHFYVDLGLSVMWATCNIDAKAPLESGSYFAWGEVKPKDSYSWDNYAFSDPKKKLTKYCFKKTSGSDDYVDDLTTLLPEDDAAVQNWGNGWRMPTNDDFEELRSDKCRWEWLSSNGVSYYKVTGPSGKSILLPACGCINGHKRIMFMANGCLWSSSLSGTTPEHAYELTQYNSGYWKGSVDRFYGEPIRPVFDPQSLQNDKTQKIKPTN